MSACLYPRCWRLYGGCHTDCTARPRITAAEIEAACAADFAHGQPGVDPDAAWAMLADHHKPAIRARVRAALEAGRGT